MKVTLIFIKMLLLAGLLIFTKNAVKDLKDDLNEVNNKIQREKDRTIALNAELSYLARLDRLKTMAEKYLDLVYPDISKIDVIEK